MLYYFDEFGWQSVAPLQGRYTEIAPPAPTPPAGLDWNFTGFSWVAQRKSAPPPYVPSEVTMRQARRALLDAGILAVVQATIDSLPEPGKTKAQIDWDYAATVKRSNPLIAVLAAIIPLTDAEMDSLFLAAEAIND